MAAPQLDSAPSSSLREQPVLQPRHKRIWDRLPGWRSYTDLLWPSAGTPSASEVEQCRQLEADDIARIDALKPARIEEAIKINETLLADEKQRRQSVESRLGGILGLTSVASGIVVAVVTYLTKSDPRATAFTSESVVGIAAAATYIAAQFLCALGAAIRGVGRASLKQHTFESLMLPEIEGGLGGPDMDQHRRLAKEIVHIRWDLSNLVNAKVTQMEVAHCALRNAVRGMLIIAISLLAITIQQTHAKKSRNPSESVPSQQAAKS